MEIKITKAATLKEKPDSSTLGFGKIFTDHMFMMDWNSEKGWYNARIVPFGRIDLHPASTVLHYGAEIFEGMKALITFSYLGIFIFSFSEFNNFILYAF